jgi:hypothetical protein
MKLAYTFYLAYVSGIVAGAGVTMIVHGLIELAKR